MSYQVAATGVAAVATLWVLRYLLSDKSVRGKLPIAPLNEASWWLGHEYSVVSHEMGVQYGKWTRMLGPVYRIKAALWQKDAVIVSDHHAVKHIFQNSYNYTKSPAFQSIVIQITGKGIVWAEQDEHKFQRRMVSPAFSITAIRKMAPTVMYCAERMISRIQRDLKGGPRTLNICEYIPACTLDIIGQVGFGVDFGPHTEEGSVILSAWHRDLAFLSSFSGFLAPVLIGVFPWITKLPIKALHEETTAKKIIFKVGTRLLAEGTNDDATDVFSILIRERNRELANGNGSTGLSNKTILDNILSFFMAGFETTAAAVTCMVHQLALQPRVQEKLRQELMSVELTDFDAIDALPYLDVVVREGLRLNTTGPDSSRVAVADDVIPLKNPVTLQNGKVVNSLPVRAGDSFIISHINVNTDPAVWGPDAYELVPERWLKGGSSPPNSQLPSGPFSNLSNFIDGPRVCIGWRLALQEIKVMLSFMVKSFEFKDTGVQVKKYLAPGVTPYVDGEAAQVPLFITPIQH